MTRHNAPIGGQGTAEAPAGVHHSSIGSGSNTSRTGKPQPNSSGSRKAAAGETELTQQVVLGPEAIAASTATAHPAGSVPSPAAAVAIGASYDPAATTPRQHTGESSGGVSLRSLHDHHPVGADNNAQQQQGNMRGVEEHGQELAQHVAVPAVAASSNSNYGSNIAAIAAAKDPVMMATTASTAVPTMTSPVSAGTRRTEYHNTPPAQTRARAHAAGPNGSSPPRSTAGSVAAAAAAAQCATLPPATAAAAIAVTGGSLPLATPPPPQQVALLPGFSSTPTHCNSGRVVADPPAPHASSNGTASRGRGGGGRGGRGRGRGKRGGRARGGARGGRGGRGGRRGGAGKGRGGRGAGAAAAPEPEPAAAAAAAAAAASATGGGAGGDGSERGAADGDIGVARAGVGGSSDSLEAVQNRLHQVSTVVVL